MLNSFDSHRSGGFLQSAATVIAVMISALASFQFFATYSGGLLAGLIPDAFLSIGAGLIGVIMLEGGALYWQRSLQYDADSEQQVQIARAGYLVSVILSVTITMLYFLMTSELVAPYLGDVAPVVNGFAAIVLIGIVGFQFTAKMQYSGAATTSVEARQRAEIGALANSARFTVERESTRADLAQMLSNIEAELPAASKEQGRRSAQSYLDSRYGNDVEETRAPLSVNGQK